ncbi:ArnT family glycosyltransferase [Singulisphaera acidiphila]|uniref:PMT family glycosyltransferase, 4-amino-4-deoxy-L-arabinose transferase n=1 Tax=Singulisphaera acidiphila (strain ATCC BAA-1392 / DSM 18658 / VKM B-2454 / MOB10) TaxID=886293 RepID=L0DA14_SINAD|nr:glycosyltransferase family 39 protein [Singulisphaera acidiphila]AGA26087.1 PMT family glycosyltransferase, 4-amino-4-deoxy-L-arabinose transferase [Singulisphaera acidiphila DSM 18658]
MSRFDPSTRRELLAVSILTVLGAGLRFWGYGALGLNHFDEGIYALSGLWSMAPHGLAGLDPMVIAYAPPGFPILVGLCDFVVGISDVSVILASTLCGVATIPVAAWVGRRTFGAGAGAAAAALAALSMPHVAFSRKALTDVPFGLAWLIAIGLGGRFLEKPTLGRALALGLGVGLAQQFKYNGWLAGAIVALAALVGLVWHSDLRRSWLSVRQLRFGPIPLSVIAAGVALLVYWPWFQFVERHGGYHALLTHHRSYLGGLAQWFPYWKQQQAQLVALSGGVVWGAFTWFVAWLACAWSRNGSALLASNSQPKRTQLLVGLLGGGLVLASLSSLPWWVGLAAAPWLLVAKSSTFRMLGSWWLILSILTPFYHPYARLWLPLHLAGWLLVAGLLVKLLPSVPLKDCAEMQSRPLCPLLPILVCCLIGFGIQWSTAARCFSFARFYQETSTLRDVVTALPQIVPPSTGREPELIVLGRRPLAFYLLLQGRYPFRLVEGLDDVLRQSENWAILDDALFDAGVEPVLPPGTKERVLEIRDEALDPVTLLDIAPGSALARNAIRSSAILVLKPAGLSDDALRSRVKRPSLLRFP